MLIRLVCLLTIRVPGWLLLLVRSEAAKDAQISAEDVMAAETRPQPQSEG